MSAPGTRCPSCRLPMTPRRFERRLSGEVEIDLCFACQGIWFDDFESPQISPGGIIDLFELIHAHRAEPRQPLSDVLRCPRCDERLLHAMDRVRSGQFNYYRCLQNHGRFTGFAQLMIEKGFVRQLNGAEVDALRARIEVVHCSGCGAPIDIRKDSACGHCRAPIAILDPEAVEQALATYRQAEVRRTSRDPLAVADALIELERQKSRRAQAEGGALNRDLGDLVLSGAEVVWKMLHR